MPRSIAVVFSWVLVLVAAGCSKPPPALLVVRVVLEDKDHIQFTAPGGTLEKSIGGAEQRGTIKDPDASLETFVTSKDGKTVEVRLDLSVKGDAVLYVEKFPDAKVTRLGQPQEVPIKLKPGRYEFQITASRS